MQSMSTSFVKNILNLLLSEMINYRKIGEELDDITSLLLEKTAILNSDKRGKKRSKQLMQLAMEHSEYP